MRITVNGKTEDINEKISLTGLILTRGLLAEDVAIEHNLDIIPRARWQDTFLGENDVVEIVGFFGGG